MKVTLKVQLDYFDKHIDQAIDDVILRMQMERESIKRCARRTLIQKYREFGDGGFHRTPLEIADEVWSEMQDAPTWRVIGMWTEGVGRDIPCPRTLPPLY